MFAQCPWSRFGMGLNWALGCYNDLLILLVTVLSVYPGLCKQTRKSLSKGARNLRTNLHLGRVQDIKWSRRAKSHLGKMHLSEYTCQLDFFIDNIAAVRLYAGKVEPCRWVQAKGFSCMGAMWKKQQRWLRKKLINRVSRLSPLAGQRMWNKMRLDKEGELSYVGLWKQWQEAWTEWGSREENRVLKCVYERNYQDVWQGRWL